MYQFISDLLERFEITAYQKLLSYSLSLILVILVCIFARLILRYIVEKLGTRIIKRTKFVWDSILMDNRLFHRLANIMVPVVLSIFLASLPEQHLLLDKAVSIAGIVVSLLIADSLLNSVNDIYNLYEISKVRPIHSLLQVVKAAIFLIGFIIGIAVLLGESPLVLLGGIGAMTAVTSLVFKDAILGFVAGVQLTTNDMIRIGDWIEMPKHSADGTVIDLTMTTVKVENFDKTITSIPAYAMVSDAFINWRGMEDAGGRRIKRAIYIDAAGMQFCDREMLDRFKKIALLQQYLERKKAEIDVYNQKHQYDLSEPVNGRKLTNIGVFRAYILAYLKQHPGIHQGMTIIVRQLAPQERGMPLEIYAFANTVKWAEYEDIQSDIFDHLYTVVQEFGLDIYQQPSSRDLRMIGRPGGDTN